MEGLKKIIRTVLEGQRKINVVPSHLLKVFPNVDDMYASYDYARGKWSIHDKFGWLVGFWDKDKGGKIQKYTETKYGIDFSEDAGSTDDLEQAVKQLWLIRLQEKADKKSEEKSTGRDITEGDDRPKTQIPSEEGFYYKSDYDNIERVYYDLYEKGGKYLARLYPIEEWLQVIGIDAYPAPLKMHNPTLDVGNIAQIARYAHLMQAAG